MQTTLELDESKKDACSGLLASARQIDDHIDHEAAILEREAAERNIMLMHIERYVSTPFGYFPPLL